jgi:hypothetical protein
VLHATPGQTVAYFSVALLAYTPMSYYTDQWMFKRRQRSKAKRGGGKAASR